MVFHSVLGWSRRCRHIVPPCTRATFKSPLQLGLKISDWRFLCICPPTLRLGILFGNQLLVLLFIHPWILENPQFFNPFLKQKKGPDRNYASPLKWCKWPACVCWIYLRHPGGSLMSHFINQLKNFLHLSFLFVKFLV